jgi:hypothetical protein
MMWKQALVLDVHVGELKMGSYLGWNVAGFCVMYALRLCSVWQSQWSVVEREVRNV